MTTTTANLNPNTRTIIQRARNNALSAAANAVDEGNTELARYNTGRAGAFTLFIKNRGNLKAVYDAYPSLDPAANRAGYRDAYDELARLA